MWVRFLLGRPSNKMLDQLKEKKIEELNKNLEGINHRMGNLWFAFGKGLLTGLGSVLGAGIAVILIGWFLNVIGVIPALQNTANDWREVFKQTQDVKNFIPGNTAE
jgi:hypothetical protein